MEPDRTIAALASTRSIFLRSLAFIAAAGIISFAYSREILLFLVKATGINLYYLAIPEVFLATVELALYAGVFFAFPVIVFLIWYEMKGFLNIRVAHGLLLAFSAVLLFYGGSFFCYKVVLPSGINFLVTGYEGSTLAAMISVERYIVFSTIMIFAFGMAFEIPLILLALGRFGIVRSKTLVKTRRYAILGVVIVAAFITPTPDVYNLMLLSVPMYIFYEIGILLVRTVEKNR